jgi:hypothetical protein
MQIDRTQIFIADSNDQLERMDIEYWNNTTAREKFETVTYLRECFYGPEATTGRLQRFHTMLELE